ncbi:mitochondrial presequence protease related protein [Cyclospora cayetanensis]|uniref:Mitochondrial presequence protease related protein n=1 Tax=Cyclospora cayetanensis TaxID=88456 RepID=A0A1D3CSF4_9EIME|nr:mitochondrial presequence protease related protein [Cyclospora cayetanensis]
MPYRRRAPQWDPRICLQTTPQSPENVATLPLLQRSDIDAEAEKIPIHVDSVGSVPLVTHDLPTSGLVYIDVALSLDALTLEEIQYLPLLGSMLTEAGTEQLPPEDLLPLIGQHTGGISASFAATPVPSVPYTVPEPVQAKGFLFLSGKTWLGSLLWWRRSLGVEGSGSNVWGDGKEVGGSVVPPAYGIN